MITSVKPPKTKGERTRARILEVAEEMFSEFGYDGTALRDIAAEVPIQQPGLYNHFDTKEDLYGAVIDQAFEGMFAYLAASSGEGDAEAQVQQIPVGVLRYLGEHPRSVKLIYRELLADQDMHPAMERWLERLLGVAVSPVRRLKLSRREQIVAVVTVYSAVTGFFAIGPSIARLIGEELDFERDQPLHTDLLRRFVSVTVDREGS